ncbi:MAG: hypothetical protein Q9217_004560 [Psora testacea]
MATDSVSSDIVYLRPQTDQAIAIFDLEDNIPFQKTVAPPPEPSDIPLEGIPEPAPSSHLSPYITDGLDHTKTSRDNTPDPYAIHPRVCRLGFDTKIEHSTRGFAFGSSSDSDIKMANRSEIPNSRGNYFRIHYNFESGALLITAMEPIRIGATNLQEGHSLLLMVGTSIHCGDKSHRYEFTVEFPDLTHCGNNQHEHNYRNYAARLGVPDAPYLATLRNEDQPIGSLHRSKALLGKGGFGEVHKAVHIWTGKLCAIKRLARGDKNSSTGVQLKEVEILSKLSHFDEQICIKMELAANDLRKHLDARKENRRRPLSIRCICSVGRQALLAIEYLHGQGVTHRDLKPENILVTGWDPKTDIPIIKLADFGLASLELTHGTICGTQGWLAPEI